MHMLVPEDLGIAGNGNVYRNLAVPQLVEKALRRREGALTDTGALVILTGKYTGRSPKDKFIVDTPAVHDEIHWGKINFPIDKATYLTIKAKMQAYLQHRELFVFDGFAGADPKYTKRFRIVNEYASQNLFMHQLLIRPTEEQLRDFEPDFTMYCAPGFQCLPGIDGVHSECAILLDLEDREILIAGNQYSGEMKKAVFTAMNYVLPKMGVLPLHCSANMGSDGSTAIFLGLSGTGKTTLSADPKRALIGDDEHGWTEDGVFNIEGGCYAKCIGLKREHEPEIYDAIRFGSMLENVITDEKGHPDYDDGSLTENTRAGYPVDFIDNAVIPGVGGVPNTVIFLTADAFGVLPPISRLNEQAAAYYFVSGYTSKLAGTERGIKEPVTTFSSMFGEPFFPMRPSVYANMFVAKLRRAGLPRQHRLVRRQGGRRAAHEAQVHARYGRGRHQRRSQRRRVRARSLLRRGCPEDLPERAGRDPQPEKPLEGQGRLRAQRPAARAGVRGEHGGEGARSPGGNQGRRTSGLTEKHDLKPGI